MGGAPGEGARKVRFLVATGTAVETNAFSEVVILGRSSMK